MGVRENVGTFQNTPGANVRRHRARSSRGYEPHRADLAFLTVLAIQKAKPGARVHGAVFFAASGSSLKPLLKSLAKFYWQPLVSRDRFGIARRWRPFLNLKKGGLRIGWVDTAKMASFFKFHIDVALRNLYELRNTN